MGKGLQADHSMLVEGKSYTALEHAWDEGFGYFGAAQDYLEYTDDEIAGKGGREDYQGHHDTNGDGEIDLKSEFNWGHAVNAAKRDRGGSTDFTFEGFEAFLQGRALIASWEDNPTAEQLAELIVYRDQALLAWEGAIAATAVHYINDVITDMNAAEADYDFYTHAKHWSELKGFALSFQFNRLSPITAENFARLHTLIGQQPVLPGAATAEELSQYETDLLEARQIIGEGFGFTDEDVANW